MTLGLQMRAQDPKLVPLKMVEDLWRLQKWSFERRMWV